jgi:predicted aspartyl protease
VKPGVICIVILMLLTSATGFHVPPETELVRLQSLKSKAIFESDSQVIPFTRAGNLILIEATVDGQTGNFILDTGAPYLVLNKTYFRSYQEKKDASAYGIAGETSVLKTWVENLTIHKIGYKNLVADLTELGHIENKRGVKILGLIGVSMFTDLEIIIDLSQSVIHVNRTDKSGAPINQIKFESSGDEIPFFLSKNVILVYGYISGKKYKFCFDTGAEISVLSSKLPKPVYDQVKVNRRFMINGTAGSKVEVLGGELSGVLIGTCQLKNLKVLIANLDAMGRGYGTELDGMLGFDFLTKGKVSINFASRRIRFVKEKEGSK